MMPIYDLVIALGCSLARMMAAYIISVIIALVTGSAMARNRVVEAVTLPILDVLQSIPILGFFPVVLVFFIGSLPKPIGAEAAAVFLIVTSLVWNMIFGVYASIKSLDASIFDMARVFSLGPASKFFYIYTPASKSALLANTLVSWAGGWFFLTSAEVISMGEKEYRLLGVGSFILESFDRGDYFNFYLGVCALILAILLTYVLVWNPAITSLWSLPLVCVGGVYDRVSSFIAVLWDGVREVFTYLESKVRVPRAATRILASFLVLLLLLLLLRAITGLSSVNLHDVAVSFVHELPLSLLRVALILLFSFLLSLAISYGTYKSRGPGYLFTLSGEILASIPAIIWWPLLARIALASSAGPLLVSFIVLLQGAVWYLFFNIIVFGLANIRREHEELALVYKIRGRHFFSSIFLPSISPSVASGALSAWGGAWNATVVAEYVVLSGKLFDLGGVGALLNRYTAQGKTGEVALAALFLSVFIVLINKAIWSRIFSGISGRFAGE